MVARDDCRPGRLVRHVRGLPPGPAKALIEGFGLREQRYLVVADGPGVADAAHDHAEVEGPDRPVGEREVDTQVAEDQVVGKRAGFADRVRRGHADRLGVVVLGDAVGADTVRVQSLEDCVLGEQ